MKLSIEATKEVKDNSIFLKMILDLNTMSNEYKVVGDIIEIYTLDSNDQILESIKLYNRVYSYKELEDLLKSNLYIIFLSLQIYYENNLCERIDIYDVSYVDIENENNEYERYIDYLKVNSGVPIEFKYEVV
ncbi:hypothetical protein KQ51_01170 [Candidatus Izimaplasma bacterium HR1]|jgi:hypothetical protein|uniref:hypothetical protein n=1 Tax=Candidatus Izimoplasma sp. HR1 TaxID=1541959 RepID=UPI0004F6342A|nr:hypothetical protein KQ51_01170 [Candidatus Izimaplasma bacterium HR1]